MKGEVHVLQWGEEVYNVAFLGLPDQNHKHLIHFILCHPQPFTSLISSEKRILVHVKDFRFWTAAQIMKHKHGLLEMGCLQLNTKDGKCFK